MAESSGRNVTGISRSIANDGNYCIIVRKMGIVNKTKMAGRLSSDFWTNPYARGGHNEG